MSFTNSVMLGTGNAIAYQIIDTVSQYADSKAPLISALSNGEIVMISSGLIMLGIGWYAYRKGYDVLAALGVELGPLLLVSGILDIFKRKLGGTFSQVAQIKKVPPPVKVVPPAPSEKLAFTPQL